MKWIKVSDQLPPKEEPVFYQDQMDMFIIRYVGVDEFYGGDEGYEGEPTHMFTMLPEERVQMPIEEFADGYWLEDDSFTRKRRMARQKREEERMKEFYKNVKGGW